MLLMGIDCGTQGLKAILWDSEKNRIWTYYQSYELIQGLPPGHKEQHPQTWIDALNNCIASIQAEGPDLSLNPGYWCVGSTAWLCCFGRES